MRIDDDPALGRLPEHVGQAHDRNRTGSDDVCEHLAGANRGQLVNVADKQQGGMIGHGLQQRLHQQDIDHRAFVHPRATRRHPPEGHGRLVRGQREEPDRR